MRFYAHCSVACRTKLHKIKQVNFATLLFLVSFTSTTFLLCARHCVPSPISLCDVNYVQYYVWIADVSAVNFFFLFGSHDLRRTPLVWLLLRNLIMYLLLLSAITLCVRHAVGNRWQNWWSLPKQKKRREFVENASNGTKLNFSTDLHPPRAHVWSKYNSIHHKISQRINSYHPILVFNISFPCE